MGLIEIIKAGGFDHGAAATRLTPASLSSS